MLPITLVLSALSLILSVSGGPVTGKTCFDFNGLERSEGDYWDCEDGCNTCGCSGGQITSSQVFCGGLPGCSDHTGEIRKHGASWDCEDGCNTCNCNRGTIISTFMLCEPPPPGLTCIDHTLTIREEGESWQCEDGCNTCGCTGGQITSTLILCEPPPPGLSCFDHTGVQRVEGESWECEDECNTCFCDGGSVSATEKFCSGPPPGIPGGIENTEISQEVIEVAKSAVSLLGSTEALMGDGGCSSVELVEVVKARTQVVQGTNYFLTLRLATICPGQKEERLCENVVIYEPLSVYCENPDGCLELITPQEISCRFWSPDWYFVPRDGPPPVIHTDGPSPGEIDGPAPGAVEASPPRG